MFTDVNNDVCGDAVFAVDFIPIRFVVVIVLKLRKKKIIFTSKNINSWSD